MSLNRCLAVGAFVAGVAVTSAGTASAVAFTPVPDGIQVDLSHGDTLWAQQNNLGAMVGGLPGPAATSFGSTFTALTDLASQYPEGRVVFTVVGPMDQLSGTMVALER